MSSALIVATAEQPSRICRIAGVRRFLSGVRRAHPLNKVVEFVVGKLAEILLYSQP